MWSWNQSRNFCAEWLSLSKAIWTQKKEFIFIILRLSFSEKKKCHTQTFISKEYCDFLAQKYFYFCIIVTSLRKKKSPENRSYCNFHNTATFLLRKKKATAMSQYDYLRKKGLRSLTVSTFFGIFFFFGWGLQIHQCRFFWGGCKGFPHSLSLSSGQNNNQI